MCKEMNEQTEDNKLYVDRKKDRQTEKHGNKHTQRQNSRIEIIKETRKQIDNRTYRITDKEIDT